MIARRALDATARAWARVPAGLAEAIWLAATMRLALSAFAWYVAAEEPMWAPCHFEEAHNGWTFMPPVYRTGVEFKAFGIWERWDACWYAKIAAFGYVPGPDADETAFFPLLPLLMRAASLLFSGNVVIAGLVVATIAFALALWGLHELLARDLGERVARRAMLYLAVFPTALFFFAPYTEAVFLACAVWSIVLARGGAWPGAAAVAVAAGLSRPVGAFLVLPLAWLAFSAARRGTAPILPGLAAAGPLIGFAAFTAYSIAITGETPIDAQRRWWGSPDLHAPWELVGASVDWIRTTGSPLQALNLVVLVGAGGALAFVLPRLPLEYALYALPHLALASTRILPTPLTSTTRYLMIVFPIFIALALLGERPRWHLSWIVLSLLFLALLAHGYLRGDFVAAAHGYSI